MNRREFLSRTSVLAMGVTLLSVAWAQIQGLNEAINKSGRQRMLSQRMAKSYLQLGLGTDVEHSRKILATSVTLFEQQLSELLVFAPSAENRSVFEKMESVWITYKEILLSSAPNPQAAREVMLISEKILALAQTATLQLEKHSGSPSAKLVNVAGRQRMLSQRMAKYYQALQWGVAPPDSLEKLEAARKEFIAGMEFLLSSTSNTPTIKAGLALAQQQWLFFDMALRQSGDEREKKQFATNVATTSERILEVMDGLTALYQKIA
ncbi:MAG: type IV pili methyl-accepting chemotaxis transducer N-terminal domain-containing protein [Pseudomonadota bacterium]